MNERQTIGIDAWKKLASEGNAPRDQRLLKVTSGAVLRAEGEDPAKSPIRMRISSVTRDRDRDTIAAEAWDLTDYRKNPVVLWAHRSWELPIGRGEDLTIDEKGLSASVICCPGDMNPLGPMVERMLRGGFLNASSVGFLPKDWKYNEDERGYDFLSATLLEFSIVPVPANAEALVQARSLGGIDLAPLKGWLVELLDTWPEAEPLELPRKTAERALKIAGGEPAQFAMPKELGDRLDAMQADIAALNAKTVSPTGVNTQKEESAEEDVTLAQLSDDEVLLELDDDEGEEEDEQESKTAASDDDDDELLDLDEEELRQLVSEVAVPAIDDAFTRFTGRLP